VLWLTSAREKDRARALQIAREDRPLPIRAMAVATIARLVTLARG